MMSLKQYTEVQAETLRELVHKLVDTYSAMDKSVTIVTQSYQPTTEG